MDRFDIRRHEYAMFCAMGIRKNKIMIMQLFDYIKMIIKSLIYGGATSFLACYLIYVNIRDKFKYLEFEFDFLNLLYPYIVVVTVFVLTIIPVCRKIKNINITYELQRNK